jgi:hypothetical protein
VHSIHYLVLRQAALLCTITVDAHKCLHHYSEPVFKIAVRSSFMSPSHYLSLCVRLVRQPSLVVVLHLQWSQVQPQLLARE